MESSEFRVQSSEWETTGWYAFRSCETLFLRDTIVERKAPLCTRHHVAYILFGGMNFLLRHWDACLRWEVFQNTIAWAQSQTTVRRNTAAARLDEQARKLAQLKETRQGNRQRVTPATTREVARFIWS